MSADEDTELRDLVAQTLENNGTLGKLRAQLRASVFLALEDQENGQTKTPFQNKELRTFLSTREGRLATGLVQEFLEFFNLEFTLAVFKPETGLNESEKRVSLAKELNLQLPKGPDNAPLIASLFNEDGKAITHSPSNAGATINSNNQISKDLTEKQIEDARQKFEYYDKDDNGSIDKDELRQLFMDMFPHFHRNMLERYVNDEFNAVDTDFSSSMYSLTPKAIDFDEFLGMYKRLFLLCRSVVAGDVLDIVSPTHKPDTKKTQSQAKSSSTSTPTNSTKSDLQNGHKKQSNKFNTVGGGDGSDLEEDPFFDDHPTSPVSFNTLSNFIIQRSRASYKSELEKKEKTESKENGADAKPKSSKPASSMSSLDGLPSLTSGRGMGSLADAPPLGRPKSPDDLDNNLRAIDKRMVDLGLDSHNEDFEYEDDFSPEHSISQKGSKADVKGETAENGSIAEEIDDEEIDDISIEADDLLRSEKSAFDELTTDHSISQADGGFDYMEDPVLP